MVGQSGLCGVDLEADVRWARAPESVSGMLRRTPTGYAPGQAVAVVAHRAGRWGSWGSPAALFPRAFQDRSYYLELLDQAPCREQAVALPLSPGSCCPGPNLWVLSLFPRL